MCEQRSWNVWPSWRLLHLQTGKYNMQQLWLKKSLQINHIFVITDHVWKILAKWFQRYSAVEVYVTDHKELLLGPNSTNGSGNAVQTLYNIFRTTNFIRESVVVESGCDFTFNLLPILMKNQNNSPATGTRKDDLHNYRILKSPFHKDHPIHSTPPTSFNNNQVRVPDSSTPTIGNLQQQGYLQQPHQYQPSQQLHQQVLNNNLTISSSIHFYIYNFSVHILL